MANVSDKLFADDTNVFFSLEKDIKNVCNVLNKELENMSIWIKVNMLSLNVIWMYMIFGNKYTDSVFIINIDGVVDRAHVTKFLGILVDIKLNIY